MLKNFLMLIVFLALCLNSPMRTMAGELRVVASDEGSVTVEVNGLDYGLHSVVDQGTRYQALSIPRGVTAPVDGSPDVPVVGGLIGIPFGVDVRLEIVDASYVDVNDVLLLPVPTVDDKGRTNTYIPNPRDYASNSWFPAEQASITRVGLIRDQRVAAVSLSPIQYNPVEKRIRVATRLRVRVVFGRPPNTRPVPAAPSESLVDPIYKASILNFDQAVQWRSRPSARSKQATYWYDPLDDWFRIPVTDDGLFEMDLDWFEQSGIPVATADLSRLQVYVDGAEIPLLVVDGDDDRLDPGDRVLFWGEHRRVPDRDMESRFGRSHTYWLRFGSEIGRRYASVDGSPTGATPAPWIMHTVHSEIDSVYERLGEATDVDRDHWLYRRTGSPSSAGNQEFPVVTEVELPGLASDVDADAEVRVGMHGISLRDQIDFDHRTLIEIQDGILVTEDRWDGQTAFTADGTVSANVLTDTVTVTLRTPGSPEFPFEPIPYVDHVRLNWTAITYPRLLSATGGQFGFSAESSADYQVRSFASSPTFVLDVLNGERISGEQVVGDGGVFSVTFSAGDGRFLVVDSTAYVSPPLAVSDDVSELRSDLAGASYVIVTDKLFIEQAERLAEHRRSRGLTSLVVDIQDIYDEFSYGDLTEKSVQDFMRYAYENWTQRPVYLLLFGRMTFDYRDILDEAKNGRRSRVPAMPFQSVRRGQAFTDHFYGTVSGDDPFMDVWVGRTSINNIGEAETVASKIIGYDNTPDDVWRSRATFLANWDAVSADSLFIFDSDRLIRENTDPLGLEALRIYHAASTPPEPNESSSETINQINEGRLLLNFMGHGSAATMQKFMSGTFQQRGFNYMAQITNGEKLPLVIAMSCLNGLYDEPTLICFAEEMVNKADGGAIAYVSASSLAFIFVNNEVNQSMLRYMMREGVTDFGAALAISKTDLLAASPGIDNGVVMMNLMGDPAQHLAIPSGPDYSIASGDLQVTSGNDVLATSDTARVVIRVRNAGIVSDELLEILVLDRNLDTGGVDTVGTAELGSFGFLDSTAVLWPLSGLTGRHRIDVILDPASRVTEIRQDNNQASVDVEVFGRLSAVSVFPFVSQEVTLPVRLGVRTGVPSDGQIFGEFELNRSLDFEDPVTQSGLIPLDEGLAIWTADGLSAGDWFWRARVSDGVEAGAWTQTQSFLVGEAATARTVSWRQNASEASRLGEGEGVVVYGDGSIGRTTEPLPLRITADFREETITAEEVPATAVLATNGTFHFVKGFFSSGNIYPDSDSFLKVGSGLNGTTAGQNLGPASDPSILSVSATYHSDGFVYSDNRKAREITRISPTTGQTESIPVPAGLLEIRSGLVFDGHSLITSDGNLIYNVANGVNGIPRVGWSVRVFDPLDWSIVREYAIEPTSNGFTFAFTDGLIADGKYLYLIEFSSGASHRVRVVDAVDGSFVEEYQSDQEDTDLLSGQFDWVNNKVWFGQLNGNQIHRYTGRRLPDEGILTSAPVGPASAWNSISVNLAPGPSGSAARVDVLGETNGGIFLPIAEWSDLAAGTIDLADLDPWIGRIKLRTKMSGESLSLSPSLLSWTVRYQPVSDVVISNLALSTTQAKELDPVLLSVDAVNRGPIDLAFGTVVAFYAGDPESGRVIGRQAVPENTVIGVRRRIEFAWITAQFPGTHQIHARVEDLFGNEAFFRSSLSASETIQIEPSTDADIPTITIQSLDSAGEIRSGDYLPADTDFQVTVTDSSGISNDSVEILLTSPDVDQPVAGFGSNLVSDRTETLTFLSFHYSPSEMEDGTYILEIRASDRLGNGPAAKALSFQITSELRLESVLTYPNPMATNTDFTFLLSRPSEVTVKVFTIAGRLIRILEERSGRAGYNQMHWDGRDSEGRTIANGTYLYTITADDGADRVRKKEALIVYR